MHGQLNKLKRTATGQGKLTRILVLTLAWFLGGNAPSLTVQAGELRFERGDANGDTHTDLSDGIFLLLHLFASGRDPACLDAADADDSGAIDITDPIALLRYLFVKGPQPPPPFLGCGLDPTPDALDCTRFDPCTNGTLAAPVVSCPDSPVKTSDTTPRLRGTAKPNSTIEVFEGGNLVISGPVESDGNWTIEIIAGCPSWPVNFTHPLSCVPWLHGRYPASSLLWTL